MVLSKLFGTKSERETKKLIPIVKDINQFYETLSSKSDEYMSSRTSEMREMVIKARQNKKDSLPDNMNRKESDKIIKKAEQNALNNLMIEAFVEEERYEDAAKLRDQLMQLGEENETSNVH